MSNQIAGIKDGDLYALLSDCSDEELEPLVKCITDRKWTNFLDINEDYNKHHPLHSKYHKTIGDEIRRFGGNTLRNMSRGGGPTYEEIVIDVCKGLDIPFTLDSVVKSESTLLDFFLKPEWKILRTLDLAAQDRAISDARREASKQANILISKAKHLVAANTDPAIQVTAYCVLHIAYLRKTRLEPAPGPNLDVPISIERSAPLFIGTPDGGGLLSLAPISEPKVSDWRPVDDSGQGISRLNPLLQAVPSIVTAQQLASTKYMEVVINGPLLRAKGADGYRLIAMTDGKPSHGTLLDPAKLSNIVNTVALLQIASVALAQKHLADISQKLTEIRECVERIHQFQNNQRLSLLTGAIKYFEQVAHSVLGGDLSDSIRIQIESHEAELLKVQYHLLTDIRNESRQIPKIKSKQEAIEEHQRLMHYLYMQLFLCIRARACRWQLLLAFPDQEQLKDDRKRDIQTSLNELADGLLGRIFDSMRQKIRCLSYAWPLNSKINEQKLSLLQWNDDFGTEVAFARETIFNITESVLQEQLQPVKLILKIEKEKIVATSNLV